MHAQGVHAAWGPNSYLGWFVSQGAVSPEVQFKRPPSMRTRGLNMESFYYNFYLGNNGAKKLNAVKLVDDKDLCAFGQSSVAITYGAQGSDKGMSMHLKQFPISGHVLLVCGIMYTIRL